MIEKFLMQRLRYGQEEIDALVKCLKESTQMGKNARKIEERIAKLFDKEYSLFC